MQIFKTFFFRHPVQLYRSTTNCFCKRYVAPASPAAQQCTQVRFTTFRSARFSTAVIVNPPDILHLCAMAACSSWSPHQRVAAHHQNISQVNKSAPSNLALIRPTSIEGQLDGTHCFYLLYCCDSEPSYIAKCCE